MKTTITRIGLKNTVAMLAAALVLWPAASRTARGQDTVPTPASDITTNAESPGAAAAPLATPPNGNGAPVTVVPVDSGNQVIPGAVVTKGSGGENISVAFDKVTVSDAVRLITKMAEGASIVMSTNIETVITVTIQDKPWDVALGAILDNVGLALVQKVPGIYTVAGKQEAAAEPLVSDVYFLKYTTVTNLLPVIQKMLISTNGTATGLNSANAIMVLEKASHQKVIKANIDQLDKPRPQVFIEAKFVELNDQAIKDIGINWTSLQGYRVGIDGLRWGFESTRDKIKLRNDESTRYDRRGNSDRYRLLYDMNNQQYEDKQTTFEESPPGSGNYVATTTIEPTREIIDSIESGIDINSVTGDSDTKSEKYVRTAVLSADEFSVVLSALKQNNGVSVVSNPKIIVQNGERAEIHVGEKRPNVIRKTNSTQGGTAEVTYEFAQDMPWIDIGVKVGVTPTVNTESNITLKIEPELDRQVGEIEPTPGLTFPVLVTRRIATEFALESGRTAAIGGLIQNSDQERVSKVPLLGDIPLIGKYLFTHTHTEKVQDEIVIFVTVNYVPASEVREVQGVPSEGALIHRHLADKAIKESPPATTEEGDKKVKLR